MSLPDLAWLRVLYFTRRAATIAPGVPLYYIIGYLQHNIACVMVVIDASIARKLVAISITKLQLRCEIDYFTL